MATCGIPPTAEPDPVIAEPVGAGLNHGVCAAMSDALQQLRQRLQGEQLTLDILRAQINAGLDSLERGAAVAP